MRSHWDSRARDESGFSILEVVVAFTILVVAIFAIEYGVAQTTAAGVDATQMATEASLASQAIVQAEALPFYDLQAGASPTDSSWVLNHTCSALLDWPQVAYSAGCTTGGTYRLAFGSSPGTVGTVLDANTNTGTQAPPVVPFSSTHILGKVTYDVAVFATSVSGAPNLVRVTAIVERVLASATTDPTCPPLPTTCPVVTTTTAGAVVQQVVLGPK